MLHTSRKKASAELPNLGVKVVKIDTCYTSFSCGMKDFSLYIPHLGCFAATAIFWPVFAAC